MGHEYGGGGAQGDEEGYHLCCGRRSERLTPPSLAGCTADISQKDLARLKLSLHMLRNVVHSTLPVELYHFNEEFTDPSLRQELSHEYGITFKAVDGRRPNGKSWSEWAIHPGSHSDLKETAMMLI